MKIVIPNKMTVTSLSLIDNLNVKLEGFVYLKDRLDDGRINNNKIELNVHLQQRFLDKLDLGEKIEIELLSESGSIPELDSNNEESI
jgi:hypothetical protein